MIDVHTDPEATAILVVEEVLAEGQCAPTRWNPLTSEVGWRALWRAREGRAGAPRFLAPP
jgi:hypothetical protein